MQKRRLLQSPRRTTACVKYRVRGKRIDLPDMDWAYLLVDGVSLEIVNADAKVASGTAGTVVYWSTSDFDARRLQLEQLGASLYRGPMKIDNERWMAQFRDPFGNLLGIRGPRPVSP